MKLSDESMPPSAIDAAMVNPAWRKAGKERGVPKLANVNNFDRARLRLYNSAFQ